MAVNLKKCTIEYVDYNEMEAQVEAKYDITVRDFANKYGDGSSQFSRWCSDNGYPKDYLDEDGKALHSSQIVFAKFKKDIVEGTIKEIPYQDFWHYMCDGPISGFHRGAPTHLNWKEVLDDAVEEKGSDSWQAEIAQLFVNEFGEDDYTVVIDW